MAFQYRPDVFPQFPVEVFTEDSDEPTVYEIPLVGYVPRPVHEEVDDLIAARIEEVEKRREARRKKQQVIPNMARDLQFPDDTDVMDELLKRLAPDLAAIVETWPMSPRQELWKDWTSASKPSDLEKSDASSDSSAATE